MTSALKYFTVYFLSGLKFVLGPVFGVANNLPVPVIIMLTTFGMMTTIYLFTFWGDKIRVFYWRFRKNRRIFSKNSRKFVKIWRKFGLKGICILTPLILTPPVGGILINLIGVKKKILKWMWISAFLWAIIITLIIKYAFQLIKDFIPS